MTIDHKAHIAHLTVLAIPTTINKDSSLSVGDYKEAFNEIYDTIVAKISEGEKMVKQYPLSPEECFPVASKEVADEKERRFPEKPTWPSKPEEHFKDADGKLIRINHIILFKNNEYVIHKSDAFKTFFFITESGIVLIKKGINKDIRITGKKAL